MDQEEIDYLNLNHATEALQAFTRHARRIEERTHGGTMLRLVLYSDGSGHVEDFARNTKPKNDISFSDLAQLAEKLSK